MEDILDFFREKKIYFIFGFVILLIIVMQVFSFCYFYKRNVQTVINEVPLDVTSNLEEETLKENVEINYIYYVDIKGEVKKPGIYKVEEGKRVFDVIELAGGLTKNADTRANNLSLKVTDEMVIIIYSKDQIKDFLTTKNEEKLILSSCNKKEYNVSNDSCISSDIDSESEDTKLISINTASKEELMTIPGIGESKAISIIEYREANGNFSSIEDIKNVSGIGDALFEKIKDYITT